MARPYSRDNSKAPSKNPCDSKSPCKACPKKRSVNPPTRSNPQPPVTSDPPPALNTRAKNIRITVVEPSDLLATDLTGRFTTISSRGYNYMIVCYIYDTNEIIYAPFKIVLLMNISEYTKIFSATWRSVASVQLSTKWKMNVPKSSSTLLWMNTKTNWRSCYPMITAPTQRRSALTPSGVILFLG